MSSLNALATANRMGSHGIHRLSETESDAPQALCAWVDGLHRDLDKLFTLDLGERHVAAVEELFIQLVHMLHRCTITRSEWIYSIACGMVKLLRRLAWYEEDAGCLLLSCDTCTELTEILLHLEETGVFRHTVDEWWIFPEPSFEGEALRPAVGSAAYWRCLPYLLNHLAPDSPLQHRIVDSILSERRTTELDNALIYCANQDSVGHDVVNKVVDQLLTDIPTLPIDSARLSNLANKLHLALYSAELEPKRVERAAQLLLRIAGTPQVDNFVNNEALASLCAWLRGPCPEVQKDIARRYMEIVDRKLRLWAPEVVHSAIEELAEPSPPRRADWEWRCFVTDRVLGIVQDCTYARSTRLMAIKACLQKGKDAKLTCYILRSMLTLVLRDELPKEICAEVLRRLGPVYYHYREAIDQRPDLLPPLSDLRVLRHIRCSPMLSQALLEALSRYYNLLSQELRKNAQLCAEEVIELQDVEWRHLLEPC